MNTTRSASSPPPDERLSKAAKYHRQHPNGVILRACHPIHDGSTSEKDALNDWLTRFRGEHLVPKSYLDNMSNIYARFEAFCTKHNFEDLRTLISNATHSDLDHYSDQDKISMMRDANTFIISTPESPKYLRSRARELLRYPDRGVISHLHLTGVGDSSFTPMLRDQQLGVVKHEHQDPVMTGVKRQHFKSQGGQEQALTMQHSFPSQTARPQASQQAGNRPRDAHHLTAPQHSTLRPERNDYGNQLRPEQPQNTALHRSSTPLTSPFKRQTAPEQAGLFGYRDESLALRERMPVTIQRSSTSIKNTTQPTRTQGRASESGAFKLHSAHEMTSTGTYMHTPLGAESVHGTQQQTPDQTPRLFKSIATANPHAPNKSNARSTFQCRPRLSQQMQPYTQNHGRHQPPNMPYGAWYGQAYGGGHTPPNAYQPPRPQYNAYPYNTTVQQQRNPGNPGDFYHTPHPNRQPGLDGN